MTATATSRLQHTIADFRTRLMQREDQAAAELERAHKVTLAVIEPQLQKLYDEMTEAIASGEPFSLYKLYEANRLETIKLLISQQIDQFGALARTTTGRLQEDGVHLGLDAALQQMQDTKPPGVSWSFGIPSTRAIESLVGATRAGSPLADLFRGFGLEAAEKAGQALISGVSLGWNPRQIAPLVQEKLDISRNRALVISRQESLRSYRGAALETYRVNDDVVGEWRWTCAKQRRTCIACILMDGKLFPLSREFFGHVQCRCSPVPVTKSWEDILGPLGIDTSGIPDTRPNIETGEAWFNRQNADIQRNILGNSGYKLWKDPNNDVTLSSFVGMTHDKDWGSSVKVRSLRDIRSQSVSDFEKEQKLIERRAKEETEHKAKEQAKSEAEKKALEEKLAKEKAAKEAAQKVRKPVTTKATKTVATVADLAVKYPHVTFEFDGIDPKLHARIAQHIDRLFTDYPEVARTMEYIGSKLPPQKDAPSYYALAVRAEKKNGVKVATNKMFLNPMWFSDEKKIVKSLKKDEAKGYHPKGTNTPESIITHEFGHNINYFLDRSGNVAANFQAQNAIIGKSVSGYAAYGGPVEAWAEAFASLYHTPSSNQTEYAKRLEKLLKKQFRGK